MKILISGGAGYIGSSITNFLIRKGAKVSVIDNLKNGNKKFLLNKCKFYKSRNICLEMSPLHVKKCMWCMLGKNANNENVEKCMDYTSDHPNCIMEMDSDDGTDDNNNDNNNNDEKEISLTKEKRLLRQ